VSESSVNSSSPTSVRKMAAVGGFRGPLVSGNALDRP
jgi:hypothetical protein